MKYLVNAFSLNMLSTFPAQLHVDEISLDEARVELVRGFTNVVGHADTAAVFASQLGLLVEAARINLSLTKGDELIVGQYRGPRLPEGCKTLPDGATIQWLRVSV